MKVSEMTMSEVRAFLLEPGLYVSEEIRRALSEDNRVGVRRLYQQFCRQEAMETQENLRLKKMHFYEEDARRRGYSIIAGVDEAGRGPLAGPVVASAVILGESISIKGINDSKKISPAKRELLYGEIIEKAACWAVGISTVEEIDTLNILQASLLAMRRAILNLSSAPEFILVDAVRIPEINMPQLPIVKGDGLSASIAAASIIAKVTRDKMMDELDREMPQYQFGRHKGYGTSDHIMALKEHGPSSIHRKTFIKNIQL